MPHIAVISPEHTVMLWRRISTRAKRTQLAARSTVPQVTAETHLKLVCLPGSDCDDALGSGHDVITRVGHYHVAVNEEMSGVIRSDAELVDSGLTLGDTHEAVEDVGLTVAFLVIKVQRVNNVDGVQRRLYYIGTFFKVCPGDVVVKELAIAIAVAVELVVSGVGEVLSCRITQPTCWNTSVMHAQDACSTQPLHHMMQQYG